MTRRDTAIATLVALLWGLNFIALHISLEVFPPFLLVTLRFVLVMLPAIFFLPQPDVPWRTLTWIGLTVNVGQFCLMYLALRLGMPAGLTSLILQVQVLITALLGVLFLSERTGRAQWAGMALGAIGLTVIGVARGLTAPILPFLLLLLAATSWAVGNIITRRCKASGGLALTVWAGAVVPLPALALSMTLEGPAQIAHAFTHLTWPALLGLAYTVYCSTHLGYGWWNGLLTKYPVARVAPFALLVPVFGMAGTTIFLNERPSAFEWFGGAILLSGVSVAALAPTVRLRRRQRVATRRQASSSSPST